MSFPIQRIFSENLEELTISKSLRLFENLAEEDEFVFVTTWNNFDSSNILLDIYIKVSENPTNRLYISDGWITTSPSGTIGNQFDNLYGNDDSRALQPIDTNKPSVFTPSHPGTSHACNAAAASVYIDPHASRSGSATPRASPWHNVQIQSREEFDFDELEESIADDQPSFDLEARPIPGIYHCNTLRLQATLARNEKGRPIIVMNPLFKGFGKVRQDLIVIIPEGFFVLETATLKNHYTSDTNTYHLTFDGYLKTHLATGDFDYIQHFTPAVTPISSQVKIIFTFLINVSAQTLVIKIRSEDGPTENTHLDAGQRSYVRLDSRRSGTNSLIVTRCCKSLHVFLEVDIRRRQPDVSVFSLTSKCHLHPLIIGAMSELSSSTASSSASPSSSRSYSASVQGLVGLWSETSSSNSSSLHLTSSKPSPQPSSPPTLSLPSALPSASSTVISTHASLSPRSPPSPSFSPLPAPASPVPSPPPLPTIPAPPHFLPSFSSPSISTSFDLEVRSAASLPSSHFTSSAASSSSVPLCLLSPAVHDFVPCTSPPVALPAVANKLATADLPVTDASGSLSGGSGSGVPAPAMGSTGSKCERPSLAEGTEQLDQLTGGIPVAAGRDAQSVRPFNARPWALLCVMILLPAASFLYGGGKYPGQSGSEGSSPVITKDLIPYDPANSRLRLEFRPSTRVAFCREHSDEVHNPVVEDLCDTLWWLMEEIPQPREESVTELEVLGVVLGFILVLLP